MDACTTFQSRWLELALDERARLAWERENEHLAACLACREWIETRRYQVRALSSLARMPLPATLTEGVGEDLTQSEAALARALRSLPSLEAPSALDRLVAADFSTERSGAGPRASHPLAQERPRQSVRALAYETVPPVLDRLVGEELAAPGLHLAERFVGGLERVSAPAALDRRVAGLFVRPLRLRVAAIVAIAASLVLAWRFALPGARPLQRNIRRVEVRDLSSLDAVARGLVEGLGGGVPSLGAPQGPASSKESR